MNKVRWLSTAIVATMLPGATVIAVDLDNTDHHAYTVKIHDGASTTNSSINGNTVQKGVCSKCELEVVGVGSIRVSGGTVVTIKDGKLSAR